MLKSFIGFFRTFSNKGLTACRFDIPSKVSKHLQLKDQGDPTLPPPERNTGWNRRSCSGENPGGACHERLWGRMAGRDGQVTSNFLQRLLLFTLLLFTGAVRAADKTTTALWFDQPAKSFHSSLPLGNGRMGAMVFGGVEEERIVLNESSVWSGSREDSNRAGAYKALPEIRRLLLEGRNVEAEKLVNQNFTCRGQGSGFAQAANLPFGSYQVLGNLRFKFAARTNAVENYRRELDLATGLALVRYRQDGADWVREYFVSAPDEVFVSRLATGKPQGLSFKVVLDRPERFATTVVAPNELLMTGTLNDGHSGKGVTYAARLRVLTLGGTVTAEGKGLRIRGADEVILLLTAATDYQGFAGRHLTDPLAASGTDLQKAAGKSFAALRKAQQADHARWFDRVDLNLPANGCSRLPTDRRLVEFAKGTDDPSLAALYFNFGRYLLISSSRPGGFPANLQGLWAEEIQTPWNGDWHLDINVQMNYWPAEVCNLSELHEPLHRLIASLVEPGRQTARDYYNSQGWVAHVFTTPWGYTAPGESADWGATVSGSAWLCEHLWEHYAFTQDKKFLRWAYPILKDSCLFYLANLIEEPKRKWLVTGPSNSPENTFKLPDGQTAHVCLGPTIDMQLLRELFSNTAQAAEILEVDPGWRAELMAKRARLAPNQIGPDGRLQEWLEPYLEPEPQHRHTSPMYGLHPYYEITPRGTPELAAACSKFLDARGDDSTGWALAWRMNLWARLADGDRAFKLFRLLLRPAGNGSGSLPNLFDSCPPFQIDGNFGGCAGVAEMLLQSHTSEIELLPALPKDWPDGSVKGLKARGDFSVDIAWANGKLTDAAVHGTNGKKARIRYGAKVINLELDSAPQKHLASQLLGQ
jgi:alpha-L-fucosidase 2